MHVCLPTKLRIRAITLHGKSLTPVRLCQQPKMENLGPGQPLPLSDLRNMECWRSKTHQPKKTVKPDQPLWYSVFLHVFFSISVGFGGISSVGVQPIPPSQGHVQVVGPEATHRVHQNWPTTRTMTSTKFLGDSTRICTANCKWMQIWLFNPDISTPRTFLVWAVTENANNKTLWHVLYHDLAATTDHIFRKFGHQAQSQSCGQATLGSCFADHENIGSMDSHSFEPLPPKHQIDSLKSQLLFQKAVHSAYLNHHTPVMLPERNLCLKYKDQARKLTIMVQWPKTKLNHPNFWSHQTVDIVLFAQLQANLPATKPSDMMLYIVLSVIFPDI